MEWDSRILSNVNAAVCCVFASFGLIYFKEELDMNWVTGHWPYVCDRIFVLSFALLR